MSNQVGFEEVANKRSFGAYGFNEITSAGATVAIASGDRFAVLEAEGDTVFSFVNEADNGIVSSAAYTLKDTKVLYGYFHTIVVASGKLKVYYAK